MRFLLTFFFLLFAVWVRAAAIAVVHAELSVPEGERRFAKSLASHVQRWYNEAGVEADLIADSTLSATAKYKVVVLVDCYRPPASVVTTVQRLLGRGTRFVVCYSASQELATLFGLKIGSYKRTDSGAWSSMQFGAQRPKGMPSKVLQTSSNIFTVTAARKETKPLAWWCDRAGKQTDVAWWRTSQGSYWMTHVLSGDGDELGKQRLLLAIAAESYPEVWHQAARHVMQAAVAPVKDGSLLMRTSLLPKSSPRREQIERANDVIKQVWENLEASLEKKEGYVAYQHACDLRDSVNHAYGMTYWARSGEIKGVWDHSGLGLYPGDWPRTAKLLAQAGITDVYVNVAGAAFALYPSKVLPQRLEGNALRDAIAACRQQGLRVHAWILCYSCTNAAKGAVDRFKGKGWTLQDAKGNDLNWLDPTHPEVRNYLIDAAIELAKSGVDGVHLDFIRFPDLPSSLGPRTKARFEAAHGKTKNWPKCITEANGAYRRQFLDWREAQIASTVLAIRSRIRAVKPNVELSAAVFGKYPACADSVGQDWISWLRTGMIDYALPMNYTENIEALKDWLGTQTADRRVASKIISGIGVTATESRLDAIDVLRQIEVIRTMKCKGFALFDLDESLRQNILPILSEGVTKQ